VTDNSFDVYTGNLEVQ